MMLGQYQAQMLLTDWSNVSSAITPDISRLSAQVINGIGFLGAGTVLVTGKQEVKGLTTAAGLWASACMGIAIGAGFYECVILAFVLIFLCSRVFPYIESAIVENARNINIYVEFDSLDNVSQILSCIKSIDTHIYEVEIDRGRQEQYIHPNATIALRLSKRKTHAKLMLALSELECIHAVEEI
jgi:putative Mg2+ transporter-C (MgtC) family protein